MNYNDLDLTLFPYNNIRDSQKEILERLAKNWDKKYYIIECGTGIGKSAIAKTICNNYTNAFILTATKQLQDQYVKDFYGQKIMEIKGRANYPCNLVPELNCEIGPCNFEMSSKEKKECKKSCNYYFKRLQCLNTQTVVTSYAYALRAWECAGFWSPRDVLVIDEAHLFEQQLTSWASFVIDKDIVNKYNLIETAGDDIKDIVAVSTFPTKNGYEENENWINLIYDILKIKMQELWNEIKKNLNTNSDMSNLNEDELEEIRFKHKDFYELDKLHKKIQIFLRDINKQNWLIEPKENGLEIIPLKTGSLFKDYVDKWGIDKIIFMSATILDINGFCKELNISKEDTAVLKMDSTFDPKLSPINYLPVCYMNHSNIEKSIPKIAEAVKEILNNHKNEKGIIHTSSYWLTKQICDNINDDRLIYKRENENNNDLLKRHKKAKFDSVIVSPSMSTGTDLNGDLSRFQIIVKLPWMSLMDKKVAQKTKINNDWYPCEMFKTLIQMCGRSTRSEEDYSTTYVLDQSFFKWINKYHKWFQLQFLKRINWNYKEN